MVTLARVSVKSPLKHCRQHTLGAFTTQPIVAPDPPLLPSFRVSSCAQRLNTSPCASEPPGRPTNPARRPRSRLVGGLAGTSDSQVPRPFPPSLLHAERLFCNRSYLDFGRAEG